MANGKGMADRVQWYRDNQDPQPYREPWKEPRGSFNAPLPPSPFRKPLRRNANAACFAVTLFYGLALGISYLLVFLIYQVPVLAQAISSLSEVGFTLVDISINVLALLLPTLLMVLILDIPTVVAFPLRAPRAGLVINGVFCGLGMSIVGSYVSNILSEIIERSAGVVPTMPDFSPPMGTPETIAYFISITVVPAVFEELLFRGAIMQSLRRFGDGFALVVSSILFAMSHGNLVQGPNAFLVGLMLGYFMLRTGSIITPMVMHFVNNALAAGINIAVLHLPAESANALSAGIFYLYILLGIAGIVLMRTLHGGFVRPLRGDCDLSEPEKYGLFFTTPFALICIVATVYLTMGYFA